MAYEGIFIRDYVGETPDGQKGTSWTNSPDILCNGTLPLQDPSILTLKSNYDAGLPQLANQTPLQQNFVYIRGINTLNVSQTSVIYLYYVDTSIVLWPQNWKLAGIIHGGVETNAAKVTADANGLVATISPYIWTPPREQIHYCLVAWVKNGADQDTPPVLFNIGAVNDMAKFILERPYVGWKNTTEVDAKQPDIQDYSPIIGAENGGLLNIGVQCLNLPIGSEIEFTVPGPDAENTIIFPRTKIQNKGYAPTVQVTWPSNFDSALTFKFYSNGLPVPDGANLIPLVGTQVVGTDFMKKAEKIAPNRLALVDFYESPAEVFKRKPLAVPPRKIFIVGSVPFEFVDKAARAKKAAHHSH